MALRVTQSPSLSPGRRFILPPRLPIRTMNDCHVPLRRSNNGPPPPLSQPQLLHRHTRSTNDLAGALAGMQRLDYSRFRSPAQTRGRTFSVTPFKLAPAPHSRQPTPIGLKLRAMSPILTSPPLMTRNLTLPRPGSPEMLEPRLGNFVLPTQRLTPQWKVAPTIGRVDTGTSPRQYRRPISQQPQPTTHRQAPPTTHTSRKSHPGLSTSITTAAIPHQPAESQYDNQMNVLRSSILTHIASVQKEINRLQTERKKAQDNISHWQNDGGQRDASRIKSTPSTLSRSSTARNDRAEAPLTTPGSASMSTRRDEDIRSSESDSHAKPETYQSGSARGLDPRRNGQMAQQVSQQLPSVRLDMPIRNGTYAQVGQLGVPNPGATGGAKPQLSSPFSGFSLNSSRMRRLSPVNPIVPQLPSKPKSPEPKVFVPRHASAARIQRAWRLFKWRSSFKSYGEKLGWVGTLDWLQKHNQLYGTELAESADIRTWEDARFDAPLDSEVDPWGCEKLQDHLRRMWFGDAAPEPQVHRESQIRTEPQVAAAAKIQALPRHDQSVGVLGMGLSLSTWNRSPSLGARQLPDVQPAYIPTSNLLGSEPVKHIPSFFGHQQRSPEMKTRVPGISASLSKDFKNCQSQRAGITFNYKSVQLSRGAWPFTTSGFNCVQGRSPMLRDPYRVK
eukprot:GEMP01021385.1.p1 GENE.GEMP01021385.1~~GEMP01021385.1.p1  ORF type:complete len:672 (+),score=79.05 GEMP01021385.1:175-2190(+)